MAKVMIFSTGNCTELYIDSDRVVHGITRASFTAEAGKPAKMELECDVDSLKIEKSDLIEDTKEAVLGYMKKFGK